MAKGDRSDTTIIEKEEKIISHLKKIQPFRLLNISLLTILILNLIIKAWTKIGNTVLIKGWALSLINNLDITIQYITPIAIATSIYSFSRGIKVDKITSIIVVTIIFFCII